MDITEIELFSQLSEDDLRLLKKAVQRRKFPAGYRLFDTGEPVRGFYHVIKGSVKVFRVSAEGQEQVLGVFHAKQTFAEAALFQDTGYPASAECLEPSELLFVERQALRDLIVHDPDFALRMLGAVAAKLRRMVTLLDTLTLHNAKERLCRYLIGLLPQCPAEENPKIQLPLSQTLLARLLGITGETLSRGLKSLVKEGVLQSAQRGRIVVANVNKLKELAS